MLISFYFCIAQFVPGEDDDEDGDESEGDYRYNVEEGFINSKKAALTAIGALAENTLAAFSPYLQRTLEVLMTPEIGALFSLHDVIRAEALTILQVSFTVISYIFRLFLKLSLFTII